MSLSRIITSSLFIIFILIAIFLYMQPKTGSILFSQKRQELLNKFLKQSKEQQNINLEEYWKFREFYSPGSFIYEKNGLTKDSNTEIASFTDLDKSATPQLLFSSKLITSVGGRTKKDTNLPYNVAPYKEAILATPTILISENADNIFIIFFKPVYQVKKVNGFLQHESDHDDKLGDIWLEKTTIRKN